MNAWLVDAERAWNLAAWTMIHFLWIGAATALVGAAVREGFRRATPGARYAVSLGTFAALALAPVGIVAWLGSHSGSLRVESAPSDVVVTQPRALPGGSETNGRTPAERPGTTPGQSPGLKEDAAHLQGPPPSPSLPAGGREPEQKQTGAYADQVVAFLPWLWLVGTPATFALLAAGLVGSQRVRRGARILSEGPAFEACERLRQSLGVARRVAVGVCESLAQPVLVGIVKPCILLPAAALANLTPEELEMVLLHELAHVRRWDNLVNLVQRIVESILFFHPAVWLVSRQVRRDREECCDAAVVAHTQRPVEYANLLVAVAEQRRRRQASRLAPQLAAASAMADHPLAGRIRRILRIEEEPMRVSRSAVGAAGLAMVALLAGVIASVSRGHAEEKPAKATANAKESKSAGERIVLRSYPLSVFDRSKARLVLKTLGEGKSRNVQSFEQKDSLMIAASAAVHDEFTKKMASRDDAYEEIKRLQTLITQAQKDLVDLEVQKQLAAQSGPRPGSAALEQAVADEVNNDPTIANYKQQILAIDKQILKRQSQSADPSDAELRRLIATRDKVGGTMKQAQAAVEREARKRLAYIPANAMREAMTKYNIRVESVKNRQKECEDRLATLLRIAETPQKNTEPKPPESNDADLYKESESNPRETAEYSIETFDRLAGYEGAAVDMLDGLKNDPFGPQAEIEWKWVEKGKRLSLKAPRKAQEVFRQTFSAEKEKSGTGDAEKNADIPADDAVATGDGKVLATPSANDPKEDDPRNYVVVYPLKGLDRVNLRDWIRTVRGLGVETQWFEKNDSLVLSAPKRVHEQVADLLAKARGKSQDQALSASKERHLASGDLVEVSAVGTLPEAPLDKFVVAVEEEGTLPLGPTYGRVKVSGLTIVEAEKTVESHLAEQLTDPKVQLRYLGAGGGKEPTSSGSPAESAASAGSGESASGGVVLYDDKSFDWWLRYLQTEIKPSRRIVAVEAMAAFARAGQGEEAVEALLDVVGELQPPDQVDAGTADGALAWAIVEAFRNGPAYGNKRGAERIPPKTWLPLLLARLDKDPDRFNHFAQMAILGIDHPTAEVKSLLAKLATSDDAELREAAESCINWIPGWGNALMRLDIDADHKASRQEIVEGLAQFKTDGFESPFEYRASGVPKQVQSAFIRDHAWAVFQVADKDGDEAITRAELATSYPEVIRAMDDFDDQRRQAERQALLAQAERPAEPAPPPKKADAPADKDAMHYDGKTFEAWCDAWKNELMVGRRLDVLEAINAFAKAGRPGATDLYLLHATEYPLPRFWRTPPQTDAEKVLLKTLEISAPYAITMEEQDVEPIWIAPLGARLKEDPKRYKNLALNLLLGICRPSAEVKQQLRAFADAQQDAELRKAAEEAIDWIPRWGDVFMAGDVDKDGAVTPDELAAEIAADKLRTPFVSLALANISFQASQTHKTIRELGWQMFAPADSNGDGSISRKELAAAYQLLEEKAAEMQRGEGPPEERP